MKLGLAEILKKASEFDKKQDKIDWLNKWDSMASVSYTHLRAHETG
jgi:hypothetical protein